MSREQLLKVVHIPGAMLGKSRHDGHIPIGRSHSGSPQEATNQIEVFVKIPSASRKWEGGDHSLLPITDVFRITLCSMSQLRLPTQTVQTKGGTRIVSVAKSRILHESIDVCICRTVDHSPEISYTSNTVLNTITQHALGMSWLASSAVRSDTCSDSCQCTET